MVVSLESGLESNNEEEEVQLFARRGAGAHLVGTTPPCSRRDSFHPEPPRTRLPPGEFRVWGLGFGVWGSGFEVWGVGSEVWGLGCGVWGLGFRAPCERPDRAPGFIAHKVLSTSFCRSQLPRKPVNLFFILVV